MQRTPSLRNDSQQRAPVDTGRPVEMHTDANAIAATLSRVRYHRKPTEAARLGISLRLLDKWIAGRVIPFRKIGRAVLIDPAEVDRVLADKWRVAAVGEPRRRMGRVVTPTA